MEPVKRTRIRPVSATAVSLTSGMWAQRATTNANVTVPSALSRCDETGRFRNFDAAAAREPSQYEGLPFNDSDVFKVLEGIATVLAAHPSPELEAMADDLVARIAAAQEPDGYLYTIRTSGSAAHSEWAGPERWSNIRQSHELYNMGHLYEAAVAYADATGKEDLLAVATKNADLLLDTFGHGGIAEAPGHEEIELGLMRLARKTGQVRYADLARSFLARRGTSDRLDAGDPGEPTHFDAYTQEHLPVLEQTEAVGHAVRALYLYSAMTEVALSRGTDAGADLDADAYAAAVLNLWHDIVEGKLYLTGGVGSRPEFEGFGEPYELPNDTAYAETCASIAAVMWAHRLFLLTGNADHYDVLERTLYNALLAGVALGGTDFYYVNPLETDGVRGFNFGSAERQPWFECSCCPSNAVRFMSTVGAYALADSDDAVYVNLYVPLRATVVVAGTELRFSIATEYPWDGNIVLSVESKTPVRTAIRFRVPGWARNRPVPSGLYRYRESGAERVTAAVNGEPINPDVTDAGYIEITREWQSGDTVRLDFPMPVKFVKADDRVEADRGKAAIERGPLVYCFEEADNHRDVRTLTLNLPSDWKPEYRPDMLGGVTVLKAGELSALPYFAWGHRGAGTMAVWLREAI